MPLAWTSRGQVQSPHRSAKVVIAQRTFDSSGRGMGRNGCLLSGRTFSIACLAFEEGQRFNVAHQLFDANSIGLRNLPRSVGQPQHRLSESVGVSNRGSAARAAEAMPDEGPIRIPPRLEDGLTRSDVVPEVLPVNQHDQGKDCSSQNNGGEKNPEHGSLADAPLDGLPR